MGMITHFRDFKVVNNETGKPERASFVIFRDFAAIQGKYNILQLNSFILRDRFYYRSAIKNSYFSSN